MPQTEKLFLLIRVADTANSGADGDIGYKVTLAGSTEFGISNVDVVDVTLAQDSGAYDETFEVPLFDFGLYINGGGAINDGLVFTVTATGTNADAASVTVALVARMG